MSMYRFTLNDKTYSTCANNRFDAQLNLEIAFGITLIGATFEEVWKLKVIRTGIVK